MHLRGADARPGGERLADGDPRAVSSHVRHPPPLHDDALRDDVRRRRYADAAPHDDVTVSRLRENE